MARLWPGLLAALLAALLYAPALGHPFVWDDAVQISENPAVTVGRPLGDYFLDRTTTSTYADYNTRIYRPLRNVFFRGIGRTLGVTPLAFGSVGLALYAALVALVFVLFSALLSDGAAALWATVLFAAAPVHVEAVCYASAVGNLLSALLEVVALLLGWAALRRPQQFWRLAVLSWAVGLAAMLAKEMAVTLVALVIGGLLVARRCKIALPGWRLPALLAGGHGLAAAAYLALRTHVVGHVGQEPITLATLATGLREAPVLLAHYAWLVVAPLGHRAAYEVPTPTALAAVIAALAAALALLVPWLLGRGALLLGLGSFIVVLVPVLHLVPLWANLANRFALAPSVGLFLAVGALLALGRGRWRLLVHAGAALLLSTYVAGTLIEQRAWRSDETLWRTAVLAEPGSRMAHGNLALILLQTGRASGALAELDAARAAGFADATLELRRASALEALGRYAEAEVAVRTALVDRDAMGPAHAVYGALLARRGALDEAAQQLARARELAPGQPATLLLDATLALAHGNQPRAKEIFVGLANAFPEPRFLYLAARALADGGNPAGAARLAERCLERDPEQAQCRALAGRSAP